MPFDEDDDNELPLSQPTKTGLKNISSQKSIFDSIPKKPTKEDFENKVKNIQNNTSKYKLRAAELASQFNKSMSDKTLPQNRNLFQKEIEKDIISQMISLAIEINNDPNEQEGMGSLGWIVLLLKTCFSQRDKINNLEYQISQINKHIDFTKKNE